jgi:hypothetical protein
MADISANNVSDISANNISDNVINENTVLDQDDLETDVLSQHNSHSVDTGEHSINTNHTDAIPMKNNVFSTLPQYNGTHNANESSSDFSDINSNPHVITNFDKFKYEFMSTRRNNIHILQEAKEAKRLLDLKYNDLVNIINNIQTSVIFTSTISGFLQATKDQLQLSEIIVSVTSISIATYISLVLSISKYYGLGEIKERIQLLKEKYSLLLNEIDFNMDILGPWSYKHKWRNSDQNKLYSEWNDVYMNISARYDTIITTKKELVTEYEDIMDTKSRNYYDIQNKKLNLKNKELMYSWDKKEEDLEQRIAIDKKNRAKMAEKRNLNIRRGSIQLPTEELDNWSFEDWNSVP